MSTKKTAKKISIWISVAISILSLFGIPIRPEVISGVEIVNRTIEQVEQVGE